MMRSLCRCGRVACEVASNAKSEAVRTVKALVEAVVVVGRHLTNSKRLLVVF